MFLLIFLAESLKQKKYFENMVSDSWKNVRIGVSKNTKKNQQKNTKNIKLSTIFDIIWGLNDSFRKRLFEFLENI